MEYSKGEKYSVLMSVYDKEKPEIFRQSIESMMNQTLPPDDFVVVCDGELNKELNDVICWAQDSWGDVFQCVRLEDNQGLGRSLRVGIEYCKNSIIARMDSDDISRPERCELQMKAMNQGDYAIVGGGVQEFKNVPGDTDNMRVLPERLGEIRVFSRMRNPFNHPCVMYRKEAVLAAGNYQDFSDFEDYYLWIRMLNQGCKAYNLQKVILDMRAGNGMYGRRGGVSYVKSVVRFQKYLRDINYIGNGQFCVNCIVRIVVSMLPNHFREIFYHKFLR